MVATRTRRCCFFAGMYNKRNFTVIEKILRYQNFTLKAFSTLRYLLPRGAYQILQTEICYSPTKNNSRYLQYQIVFDR